MSADPTREEMLRMLDENGYGLEKDFHNFDREAAIYWFANDYHCGQASNLYSVLSTSLFRPSPISRGIESDGDAAKMVYDFLVENYCLSTVV